MDEICEKSYPQTSSEQTLRSSFETDFTETDVKTKMRSIRDFEIIKYIGKGSFGKVALAKNTQTLKYNALKIIDKSFLEELGKNDEIFAELSILSKLNNNPTIIKLYSAFYDDDNLYLEIEFAENGDLREFIKAQSIVI